MGLVAKRIILEALQGESLADNNLSDRLVDLEKGFEAFVGYCDDRFTRNTQSIEALKDLIDAISADFLLKEESAKSDLSFLIDSSYELVGLDATRDFLRDIAASNQHNRETGANVTRSKKDIASKLNFDNHQCPYGGDWNIPKLNKFCQQNAIKL